MSDKYEIYEYNGAFGFDRRVLKNGKAVNEFGLLKDIQKLQAENAELKKQSQWINKISKPVNNHSDWSIGETAIAINFNSNEPYAFEIEWDGDCWCSIGGDEFTHWMPKPKGIVEA